MRLPTVAVGRVIGANHRRDGKPCQDDVGMCRIGNRCAVAVADGHGSSRYSEIGATLAVQAALDELLAASCDSHLNAVQGREREFDAIKERVVGGWVSRVKRIADSNDARLEDYGTTLIFALASAENLILGQIGDGDLKLIHEDGRVVAPIPDDPANFADETTSLCLDGAQGFMQLTSMKIPPGEFMLMLSTDGYRKSYDSAAVFETVGPGYLSVIRESGVHGLEKYLPDWLEELTTNGSGDDIGVAFMYWPRAVHRAEGATVSSDAEQPTAVVIAAGDKVQEVSLSVDDSITSADEAVDVPHKPELGNSSETAGSHEETK